MKTLKYGLSGLVMAALTLLFLCIPTLYYRLTDRENANVSTREIYLEQTADPLTPSQTIRLLHDNACKASPAGETVTISGRWEADDYRIAVVDHGRGIPAEHLDKITEPFYMEDKSRARRQGGAGLGLALCKRIADLHGTRLTFDSQAGRGTTVTLCLSVVEEAEEKGGGAV